MRTNLLKDLTDLLTGGDLDGSQNAKNSRLFIACHMVWAGLRGGSQSAWSERCLEVYLARWGMCNVQCAWQRRKNQGSKVATLPGKFL